MRLEDCVEHTECVSGTLGRHLGEQTAQTEPTSAEFRITRRELRGIP